MALPEVIATGGPATAGPTSDQFNDLIKIQSQALKTLVSIETSLVKSASQMAEAERAKLFAGAPAGAAGGAAAGGAGGGGGGGFGSLLKGAGAAGLGAGLGIGAVLAGAGLAIGGVALLLNTLAEPGLGKAIKENVDQLLSINEGNAKTLQSLDLLAVFTSLGMGLAVFGAGSAVVGLSSAINKAFGVTNWAETVHDNVIELLSIAEDAGGSLNLLAKGGSVALALAGIGVGLAWFGAGAGVAGLSTALTEYFGVKDWATQVKDNVLELLSIASENGGSLATLADGAAVTLALAGLGIGLAVFGVAGALSAAIVHFQTANWAQKIKDNVITLLSIAEDAGGSLATMAKAGAITLALTGLGIGLAVFGVGQASAALTAALADFATADWAQTIKDNVLILLSIASSHGGSLATLADGAVITLALTGLGIGLAVFGVGQASAALTDALATFANAGWAEKIKKNVLLLLSIPSEAGGSLDTMAKAGALTLALAGLGVGLAVFGTGTALLAALTSFQDPTWADFIKYNVVTLLSIPDAAGGKLDTMADGATLVLALTGLSIGLAIFGVGTALLAALVSFQKADWAETIKANVLTLLSIPEDAGGNLDTMAKAGSLTLALTGLGIGLAVFGVGESLLAALTSFQTADWAKTIKDNVITLLSIPDSMGGNVEALKDGGTVFLALSGLGAGLAIFALGTGAVAFVGAITDNKNYSQEIKDQVTTLLSIANDPNATPEKVKQVTDAMAAISASLGDFAGQTFFSALKGAGAAVFNFFSGAESPTTALLQLADKADDLEKVGNALDKIGIGLSTFSSIGSIDVDLKDLSENLKEALPDLERAIMGGYVDTKGWGGIDIKGLASPDIKYQEAAQNLNAIMNSVSGALPTMMSGAGGGAVSPGGGASSQMIESMTIRTAIIQSAVIQGPIANAVGAAPAGGATATNVIVNAPATSTTTAVSNTSETIFSASDPYVPIARRFD